MKNINSINLIAPYKYLDMWIFDDNCTGLVQEPFVGGADAMIVLFQIFQMLNVDLFYCSLECHFLNIVSNLNGKELMEVEIGITLSN